MKIYTKPEMQLLTLNGNESLCGGCSNKVNNNPILQDVFIKASGINPYLNNKVIDEADFEPLFENTASCANPVKDWCKFTSQDLGTQSAFWS